jgi:hypothetical protein
MNKKEYTTTSLPLVTFLVYCKLPLIDIRKDHKRKNKIFVFEDSENLRNLVKIYFSKKAEVEPEEFFLVLKSLKSRMYDFDFN